METNRKIGKNQPREFLAATRARPRTPAAILKVAVGTGPNKVLYGESIRAGQGGSADQTQAYLFIDFNRDTNQKVEDMARTWLFGQNAVPYYVPEYDRLVDGMLRDPWGLAAVFGEVDEEIDNLIAKAVKRSQQIAADPQIVIIYLGFGGHAILGALTCRKLQVAFPNALLLPVLLLTEDGDLQANMRVDNPNKEGLPEEWMCQSTWKAYEFVLRGQVATVLENGHGKDMDDQDDRHAIALASAEKAGLLTDMVSAFRNHGAEWMGISVVREQVKTAKTWLRSTRILDTGDGDLPHTVKAAIRRSFREGELVSGPELALPNWVYVTLPLSEDRLRDLEAVVKRRLEREGFFKEHPEAKVVFESAHFGHLTHEELRMAKRPQNRRDTVYLNVSRFYGMTMVPKVLEILHPAGVSVMDADVGFGTGLGTYWHPSSEGQKDSPSPVSPQGSIKEDVLARLERIGLVSDKASINGM